MFILNSVELLYYFAKVHVTIKSERFHVIVEVLQSQTRLLHFLLYTSEPLLVELGVDEEIVSGLGGLNILVRSRASLEHLFSRWHHVVVARARGALPRARTRLYHRWGWF